MSEYTDKNFSSSDWGLIQDCIVEEISRLKHWPTSKRTIPEEDVERLENMLERVGRKYAQTRVN
jgi:hypothetical protein